MRQVVFAIGRWMPIHLGHKQFLVSLAREFDGLVIGIGSCFENGTPRNCIPAIEREKLLRRMLLSEGISNVSIVHIQDKPTFEEWIDDVARVCQTYGVTHFCTGNKEDILNVMDSMGIHLDLEMINPEVGSDFPYHATDVRNAILLGETEKINRMLPAEILPMVVSQISREILAASCGQGQEFIPGRQTVDLIFIVHDPSDGSHHVLIGRRNQEKVDFPGFWALPGGGILEFESPIDAAARCFLAETGIQIRIEDNSCEPAAVTVENLGNLSVPLHFTGVYASADERINGTRGGGSQCFAAVIEGSPQAVKKILHSTHDLEELKFINVDELYKLTLAFDQKRMLTDALSRLGIPRENGELLEVYNPDGSPSGQDVSRTKAHAEGILHGASHIFICRRKSGVLQFLLQRRSPGKDSFPGCLDTSSAGHVEHGSDFLETAVKELGEELGLTVLPQDLEELFTRTIRHENQFRGRQFLDHEINKVYLLKFTPADSDFRIQLEELSEVVWMDANLIVQQLQAGNPEYCLDAEEFSLVVSRIQALQNG